MNCHKCGNKLKEANGIHLCVICNPDKMKKIIEDAYGINKTIDNNEPRMGGRQ